MLQQQQSSAAPPGGGAGGQGGPAGLIPPSWRQGRGLIVISAAISAISTLVLVAIIGAVIFTIQTRRPTTMYQFQQVTRHDFAQTISMSGPLQGGTYNIVFSGSGKIAEIDVTLGQAVTKGQVLARLDKTSLQDAVRQAQRAVKIAQTALNNGQSVSNATGGLSGSNIAAAQTGLKNAQANLKKVRAQSRSSVDVAQTALDNTQANLQAAEAQAEANITTARDQAAQACSSTATPPPSCTVAQDQSNQAMAAANATVTAAQAQVNSAQSQLDATRSQTATNNTAAQNQVNAAQSQVNTAMSSASLSDTSAQAQVNAAQRQLDAANAQLETAQHNLANATLTAPHDGIVTILNGTIGSQPGVPVNTTTSPIPAGPIVPGTSTFIQIVDKSVLQIQGNMGESAAPNVRVGESAQFTVAAYGNRMFRGTVSAVEPNGVTISNVVTFPVTVDVDMTSLQGAILLPGMTANVMIAVVKRSNVLLIPVNAVNFALAAASISSAAPRLISQQQAASALNKANQMLQQLQIEKPQISMDNPVPAFVLEQSNGQFVVKPVVLGLTDGTNYEVLAGLSPGETIVVGVQRGG